MRYIISILGVIVLTILAVVLIVGRNPNTPDSNSKQTTRAELTLPEYAGRDSQAVLTTDGRVNGEEEHRAIRITVSRTERRIEVLQGYNYNPISTRTYSNNQAAYEAFLRAIGGQGYLRTRDSKDADERGVCPLGNLYIYELKDGGSQVHRSWNTTCSGSIGSAAGTGTPTIRELFKMQIPVNDYATITGGVLL